MTFTQRTAFCGALRAEHTGTKQTLNGWIHRVRDHGGIFFLTLRDRYGQMQIVVDSGSPEEVIKLTPELRMEFCVSITGTVRRRPETMINPDMPTGEVELVVEVLEILSRSAVPPFLIEDEVASTEATRLQYRFLDLRSPGLQKRLILKDKLLQSLRSFLSSQGFLEIETPTLIKSTPEGARDFLVPSRTQPGSFYALPQSPQLYKQLLMVGGLDRYYQIARCYRDEDPRGDRQPEFTQVDLEMSFVQRDDVLSLTESMLVKAFMETLGISLAVPFPRITYEDAFNLYGSDKPDLRFGLPLVDFTVYVPPSGFDAFRQMVEEGGVVRALVLKKGAEVATRKKISEWEETAKKAGAKGLAWMRVTNGNLDGGISKFFLNQSSAILDGLSLEDGDVILLGADKWKKVSTAMGAVRLQVGKDLDLIDKNAFHFSWVVDFPLFDYNEEEKQWEPAHHMFSMPQAKYIDQLEENPGIVKGDLYDLVCNGLELASGSIRIHDPKLQQRIFSIVGYPEERARERFGFLLDAFTYGPPPHGGIAPGLDRLLMIMTHMETIREVIAFPKNTQMASPMDGCPSPVEQNQLKDLRLRIMEGP